MRWLPVFKKEMRLFFGSPVAYVVFTFFLLISGWFFSQIFLYYSDISMRSFMQPGMAQSLNITESVMRPLFTNMSVVLLFFMPMLTMRLFAEEKKSGTMELLLTYPVRDGEVLAGKFLAAGALYVILLGLTLVYPGLIAYFTRIEWGPILTGYLGLVLTGATFLAVGVFDLVPDREPDRGRLWNLRCAARVVDHRMGSGVRGGQPPGGAAVPLHHRAHGHVQPRIDRHQGPRLLPVGDRAGAVPDAPVARLEAVAGVRA